MTSQVSRPGRFDARELFSALAHHTVDYVTIGGIAIQAYGGQRLTQDLDVVIAASTENVARLASALLDLDARILGPDGERSRSVPSASLLAASDQWAQDPLELKGASVYNRGLAVKSPSSERSDPLRRRIV